MQGRRCGGGGGVGGRRDMVRRMIGSGLHLRIGEL